MASGNGPAAALGAKPDRKKLRWWQWGLLVIVSLIVLGKIAPDAPHEKAGKATAGSGEDAAAAPVSNAPEITMAEFSELRTGLSHAAATEIIGSPGVLLSESELAGNHTVMYQWDGDSFGSNANATFQNDKLVGKAQFGLK